MNKSLKWVLIIFGAVILILVLVTAFGSSSDEAVKVTVEQTATRTITETVTAPGKVYPEVEVRISPDISGEITELNVQEGDSVRRGQVLARIYADIYSSQRDEAAARVSQAQASVANSEASLVSLQAQVDQQKKTLDRNRQLYEDKVISKAELEQIETSYRSSVAQYNAALQNIRSLRAGTRSTQTSLEAANKNLDRTTLRAPMDGVISSLSVKKGERVAGNSFNVGTEMMRVADMSTIEVRVDVGENDIVKVSIGDSADVEVEAYNKRKFSGVVTQIASSTGGTAASLGGGGGGADNTNYKVHIRLNPASYADLMANTRRGTFVFRPGMNASAEIKTNRKENVLAVPIGAVAARVSGSETDLESQKKENRKNSEEQDEEAVVTAELEEVVFVLDSANTVKKRVVTTGIQDINYIEITSGLKKGDKVVTGPFNAVNKTLRTGTQVQETKRDKLFEQK